MTRNRLKSLFGAAAVLLLVGAGCAGTSTTNVSSGVETGGSVDSDIDAAVDARLDAAAKEQTAGEQEDVDAAASSEAEINAYGNLYDQSEL